MKNIIFFCKALMMGLCISFLLYHNSQAQLEGKNWVFGANNRISFEDSGAKHTNSLGLGIEQSANISDKDGKLLFYTTVDSSNTNSICIRDSTGKILPGGENIVGDLVGRFRALFLPFYEDSSSFLLLYVGHDGIFYKTIIKKVGGTYTVVQKNVRIKGPFYRYSHGYCAIRHGNGKDWWVILRGKSSYSDPYKKAFLVYLVTQNEVVLHNTYSQIENNELTSGGISASMNGDIVVAPTSSQMWGGAKCINFFRFDRSNGTLKDFKMINSNLSINNEFDIRWRDVSISPSGRNIFVSNEVILCQTDIHTLNLKPIYQFREGLSSKYHLSLCDHQLGLDGKIYIAHPEVDKEDCMYIHSTEQSKYLGVIENPDSDNPTYDHFGFYLNGNISYLTLPNMPNYRLGPLLFSEVAKAGQFSKTFHICKKDKIKLGTFQRDHVKYRWTSSAAGLAGIESDTIASPWYKPNRVLTDYRDTIVFVLHTEALPGSFWPGEKATDTVWVIIRGQNDVHCGGTVGLDSEENSTQDQIKIAPNPATDHIHIQLPGEMTGGTKMEIFDMQGRMILKQEISGHTDLDTGSFPDGIYLFRFQTENKPIITQKLIIQR